MQDGHLLEKSPKHLLPAAMLNSCSLKLNSFTLTQRQLFMWKIGHVALLVPYLNFNFLQGYWSKTKCASQHRMLIFLICPMASEDLLHEKPVTSLDSSMQPLYSDRFWKYPVGTSIKKNTLFALFVVNMMWICFGYHHPYSTTHVSNCSPADSRPSDIEFPWIDSPQPTLSNSREQQPKAHVPLSQVTISSAHSFTWSQYWQQRKPKWKISY